MTDESVGVMPRETGARELGRAERRKLLAGLGHFQAPLARRSVTQLAITALAYAGCVVAMYLALQVSVLLTLAIAVPAAGLVVRVFIIQHDCGHGAYFRSHRANDIVGFCCGLVTFTPYANWRRQHAGHHGVWNNLDRRSSGLDIYSNCKTLQEYRQMPAWRRAVYRTALHPLVSQVILPPLVFLVLYRVAFDTPAASRMERRGVHLTNAGLAAMLAGLAVWLGWWQVLLVQLAIMVLASIAGVWLFSVQHRFESVEWLREPDWSPTRAALEGSSYLRLPRVLQWFTGNIGFHHVHHLLPRVPNYRLEECHAALLKLTGNVRTLNFFDALRAPSFALWDEVGGRMVPFPR